MAEKVPEHGTFYFGLALTVVFECAVRNREETSVRVWALELFAGWLVVNGNMETNYYEAQGLGCRGLVSKSGWYIL